jgi:hypothetical protein
MLFNMHFALVLMKEGKLACVIFSYMWNHVVRDALVLVQEGKLACTLAFPHGRMMLFEMQLVLVHIRES